MQLKFLIIFFVILLWNNVSHTKTKEYIDKNCPDFNDGKVTCLWDLNIALENGYRIRETFKEGSKIIYMIQKRNKIAMCTIYTSGADKGLSSCELVY